jgi:hypothetical protein
MRRVTRVLVAMALLACTASHAEPTKPLDASALDAAGKLWAHASLQNYAFRFQYEEFVSPCHSWAFDVRVSHGVPEHRSDCRQYRTEFSSVPLLFKYLRHALKKDHYLVEAEFDPALGYPVRAYVAWSQMDDDFFSFEVVNFASTQKPLR